jgi:hypothetical protein
MASAAADATPCSVSGAVAESARVQIGICSVIRGLGRSYRGLVPTGLSVGSVAGIADLSNRSTARGGCRHGRGYSGRCMLRQRVPCFIEKRDSAFGLVARQNR